MKAEYFPPKEDVILQNEAPTDFYILVNGTAVIIFYKTLHSVLLNRNIKYTIRMDAKKKNIYIYIYYKNAR